MSNEDSNAQTVESAEVESQELATGQQEVPQEWETMSDEEFANLDLSGFEELAGQDNQSVGDDDNNEDEDEGDPEAFTDEYNEDDDASIYEQESDDDDGTQVEEEEEENANTDVDDTSGDIKYKEAYEKIFAPFKANGHEIKADNPDDVIRLMQMGANYNQKMQALKPSLKTLKMLERHNMLDENKLALLIEAGNGDKNAIQQLLKNTQVDPMDLDTNDDLDYKPKVEPVSDREYDLSEVMDSIKDSPHYEKTLRIVTKQWDADSKQIVVNEPHLLRTINQHIDSGIYDIVQAEMVKQRALGRLDGVSDIVAYKQIGDSLDEQGAFDHLASKGGSTTSNQRQPVATKPRVPKQQATENTRRKAASPTKKTSSAPKRPADFNPLEMSDEDFEKQFDPRLM